MKNKKKISKFILVQSLISMIIFYIVDSIYYLRVSKLIDVKKYGYEESMIRYEDKLLVLFILIVVSISSAFFYYYIYSRKEIEFEDKYKNIQEQIQKIAKGDYGISRKNVENLGEVFDELSKLIIEIKEKGKQASRDKVKLKEYIENISHQIKTPIANIKILLELENIDPGAYISEIDSEIDRINELISNLLILAKLDINKIEFSKKYLNVKDVVETSIESLDKIKDKKNIDIKIIGDDFQVYGDYYWLVEAFINIFRNSIEYSKSIIYVKLKKENAYNIVLIEDDGTGFKKKDVSKIFHRFYQTQDSKGTGIGLSISNSILREHNALIKAENDNGGKFIIKFYV